MTPRHMKKKNFVRSPKNKFDNSEIDFDLKN